MRCPRQVVPISFAARIPEFDARFGRRNCQADKKPLDTFLPTSFRARVSAPTLSILPANVHLLIITTLMPVPPRSSFRSQGHLITRRALHSIGATFARPCTACEIPKQKRYLVEEGSSRRLPAAIGAREDSESGSTTQSKDIRMGITKPPTRTVSFLVSRSSKLQVLLTRERGCFPHSG